MTVRGGPRPIRAPRGTELSCNPGMGVLRHADAGYERALEVADAHGLRIPMRR